METDANAWQKVSWGFWQTWIGLSTPNGDGIFTWTDGTPLDYAPWSPNEPSDQQNERCVFFTTNQDADALNCYQKWYSWYCVNNLRAYVCKKSANF